MKPSMIEQAVVLLEALGLTVEVPDPLLDFVTSTVTERIKNETNQTKIPDGLWYLAVEMTVGEYLKLKKNTGQLNAETFDLDAAIKQIQEGDTNTVFAIGEGSLTPEQRLDILIDYLINGRVGEFKRYRRLVW